MANELLGRSRRGPRSVALSCLAAAVARGHCGGGSTCSSGRHLQRRATAPAAAAPAAASAAAATAPAAATVADGCTSYRCVACAYPVCEISRRRTDQFEGSGKWALYVRSSRSSSASNADRNCGRSSLTVCHRTIKSTILRESALNCSNVRFSTYACARGLDDVLSTNAPGSRRHELPRRKYVHGIPGGSFRELRGRLCNLAVFRVRAELGITPSIRQDD